MLTKLFLTLLLTAFAGALAGCYYSHLASGQVRMLLARRDVGEMIADPETPEKLRQHLELVQQVRVHAAELGLEVDGQYTSFVDWPGDRVITTVVATRPGEIDAAGFWFPLVGSVPYKGFFDEERARSEAEKLRSQGLDVCLFPVPAYSTLGWLDDPLTAPMLREDRGRLAETVLHELVHATVYVADEPEFNEGLATFIGQEAAIRFPEDPAERQQERRRVEDDRALTETLISFRERVAELYEASDAGPQRDALRAALESQTRAEIASLDLATLDAERLAKEVHLTDACQALTGTYHGDLTRYRERLRELGGDLHAFLEDARRAAKEPDPRSSTKLTRGRGRSPEDPD
jgi:predicted aminopeptidase